MRRRGLWLSSRIAAAVMVLVMLSGCEGPQGTQGPQGPPGPAGPEGPQGPAGQDANQNCVQCHIDDTDLWVRQVQYWTSKHALSETVERGSSTYSIATTCAPCHTHNGFIEVTAPGATGWTTAAGFENPANINCRTCHQIHTTYTDADFAFTTTAAVDMFFPAGETVDFGTGNLCAHCHRARAVNPVPTLGGADVTFTSSRYGPHYGLQANVLGGVGAFAFTGSATVPSGPSSHGNTASNAKGCPTCHMAAAWGIEAGGHTWRMTYNAGADDNVAGCNATGCHSSVTDFDVAGVHTEVETMIDSLRVLLVAIGINDGTDHAVPGTWPADIAAAYLNFLVFLEDHSHGIHNPAYAKAVLTNTIEAMVPLVP